MTATPSFPDMPRRVWDQWGSDHTPLIITNSWVPWFGMISHVAPPVPMARQSDHVPLVITDVPGAQCGTEESQTLQSPAAAVQLETWRSQCTAMVPITVAEIHVRCSSCITTCAHNLVPISRLCLPVAAKLHACIRSTMVPDDFRRYT